MELANKTVIVTGASSEIGAAAPRLFASEGANVVLAARRPDELRSVAEDIIRGGGSASVVQPPRDPFAPKVGKAL
ncbi:SDR family NAD(P)-dependent oxidoreductase [Rhizobium sp. BK251]|uniref:SDR family NAD(P)-dependent oxidoreductase n=1 Tax=Rhizobium sp. BK251 TaxID=2512125 RepID=UPI00104F147B|nr:SDR family NAD(P)-dependent oxidoreductase [Rhizobium sp. BK251]TCL62684.1 short subunit dehydrogenase [Rhizobium sp. BK251]